LLVYAGVDPKNARQAVQATLEELVRLREGVTEEELSRAKEFSKGRLFLRLEDTRAVAGWLGAQELLTGQVLTPEEVIARIEDITTEDLKRVARDMVTGEKLNLAAVGPVSPEGLEDLLKI
jgi:predicted Zn-dependent peptidase